MELFAIGVVIILFMAVLKQFGILEPMSSFEGKGLCGAPLQFGATGILDALWYYFNSPLSIIQTFNKQLTTNIKTFSS